MIRRMTSTPTREPVLSLYGSTSLGSSDIVLASMIYSASPELVEGVYSQSQKVGSAASENLEADSFGDATLGLDMAGRGSALAIHLMQSRLVPYFNAVSEGPAGPRLTAMADLGRSYLGNLKINQAHGAVAGLSGTSVATKILGIDTEFKGDMDAGGLRSIFAEARVGLDMTAFAADVTHSKAATTAMTRAGGVAFNVLAPGLRASTSHVMNFTANTATSLGASVLSRETAKFVSAQPIVSRVTTAGLNLATAVAPRLNFAVSETMAFSGRGLGVIAGRAAIPLALASGGFEVAAAVHEGNASRAAGAIGSIFGGLGMGLAGGALVGTLGGGPVGTVIGGVAGGVLGAIYGEKVAKDTLTDTMTGLMGTAPTEEGRHSTGYRVGRGIRSFGQDVSSSFSAMARSSSALGGGSPAVVEVVRQFSQTGSGRTLGENVRNVAENVGAGLQHLSDINPTQPRNILRVAVPLIQRHFSNVADTNERRHDIAVDRRGMDHMGLPELRNVILRSRHIDDNVEFQGRRMPVTEALRDPTYLNRLHHYFETRHMSGDADFSHEVAAIQELRERQTGQMSMTRVSPTAIPDLAR